MSYKHGDLFSCTEHYMQYALISASGRAIILYSLSSIDHYVKDTNPDFGFNPNRVCGEFIRNILIPDGCWRDVFGILHDT